MAITTLVQLMMGVSLAACCGLRAWMPMLIVSLLAKAGYVHLSPSFSFLARNDALIIFGVATVLELLGDKVIVIDHFLDAIGTVVRPAVGTVLASSMLTHLDPLAATTLGLIAGGTSAFTIHAGKTVIRAKSSLLAHFHAGVGNAALSILEDVCTVGGVFLAVFVPGLAFVLALLVMAFMIWMIVHLIRKGASLWALLTNRKSRKPAPAP
ncbi:MAG: putative transrane protein [Chthonomonadaceae bacterium]|nr:putative transrane protein [Chthonomonadaceae bacterium]